MRENSCSRIGTNNAFRPFAPLGRVLLAFACSFALAGCAPSGERERPAAVDGAIDLAAWDFSSGRTLDLKGEWKFAWMKDGPGFADPGHDDSAWGTLAVPGLWNAATGSSFGSGWLRLRIKNLSGTRLGLYLKSACRSYELYVDGVRLMANGKPGTDGASTVHQRLPRIEYLPPVSGDVVLAWHIANFADYLGGPAYAIRIGDVRSLENEVWAERAGLLFVIGFILMMCVTHVIFWLGRREDRASLSFALFCLMIALRMLVINNFPALLFPALDLFELSSKAEFTATVLAWIFIYDFFAVLFRSEFPRIVSRIQLAGAAVFLAVSVFTPPAIHSFFSLPLQIFLFAGCLVIVINVVRALAKKRREARLVLGGFIVFFLTVVNDLVFTNFPGVTVTLTHVGLSGFMLFQSMVMSARFAAAVRTAERLSAGLRREVEAQTRTISEKNAELVRLNEERTDFFINLAHETKTPLTLIQNYLARYVKKRGLDDDIAVVAENIDKLKTDMVNYLDHEKLRRGRVFYDHERTVNAGAVTENRILLFRDTAARKGITIAADVEPGACVRMDPYAFDRVLNNLLENAVRYTRDGGDIRVTLGKRGGFVRLEVADTGCGIPADEREHIFKPYHQMTHRKRNTQGIGMGLSIVKEIVCGVGGRIEVESEPGAGSVFTVTLRACSPGKNETPEEVGDLSLVPAAPVTRAASAANEAGKGKAHTILVVEDNDGLRSFLTESLRPSYAVAEAENGRRALETIASGVRPDLILSDIMMDKMDGYEFLERLRRDGPDRDVPVIFLTAKTGQEERLRALSRGAVEFVAKPFDMDELLARVGALLTLAETQRRAGVREAETRVLDALHGRAAAADPAARLFERARQYGVSDRERDILEQLLAGRQDKEIAFALHISYNTVRTHIGSIYKKCGVQNKIELLNLFK